MEFGIFHEFPAAPGQSDADSFAAAFDVVDGAERWGLDAVWLAELHFDPARSVLSSPMCIASAIAARTTRLKIGIAVQVLPLCNPLRIAEEAATVDQLSRGRLIFGVGRSGVAKTYENYGVPYAESKDRFNEALDIILKAWSETGFSYSGRYHSFADVTVTPQPFQKPLPPVRVAATSADTFVTTGQQGLPIFLAVRHEDARMFLPQIKAYREAYAAAGHPGTGQVFLRAPGYLAATAAEAREGVEASMMHYFRAQAKLLSDSAARAGVDQVARRNQTAERLATITYEETLRGSVFVGTPDQVCAQLGALKDELGLDGVLLELNPGGRVPHEGVMTALRLLCQEVMPRFH